MSYSGYPVSCLVHDVINVLFLRKRRLLEGHGYFRTLSGKYHDGHGMVVDPKEFSYGELKQKLENSKRLEVKNGDR